MYMYHNNDKDNDDKPNNSSEAARASSTGPRSCPRRWISSMTTRPTVLTYARCCQCREMPGSLPRPTFDPPDDRMCEAAAQKTDNTPSEETSKIFLPRGLGLGGFRVNGCRPTSRAS